MVEHYLTYGQGRSPAKLDHGICFVKKGFLTMVPYFTVTHADLAHRLRPMPTKASRNTS